MHIFTFGAATQDIYLKSKHFLSHSKDKILRKDILCFNFGSKIEVSDILLTSGGGGTNTAATFARQGFKVSYIGTVGDDCFGKFVLSELKEIGVDISFVKTTREKPTNTSVFLSWPGRERVILVYRGASDILKRNDIPWSKIKNADWLYLAPLSGTTARLSFQIVEFAKKHSIKVAFNPSLYQLSFPKKELLKIISNIDIFILNKEEALYFTDLKDAQDEVLFKKMSKIIKKGIVIVTKGKEGALALDLQSRYLYSAPSLSVFNDKKFLDATGAGDAFGSGFLVGIVQKNNIEYAMQFGMANSGQVVTQWGAKNGLLKKGQSWPAVKVKKHKI